MPVKQASELLHRVRHKPYLLAGTLLLAMFFAVLITFVPFLIWPQANEATLLLFTFGGLLAAIALYSGLRALAEAASARSLSYPQLVEQYSRLAQSTEHLAELFQFAVRSLRTSLGANHVSVWLHQPSDNILVLTYSDGDLEPGDLHDLPVDLALETLVGTHSVAALPESALRQGWLTLGIRTVTAMRWQGELVGVVGTGDSSEKLVEHEAQRVLEWLAGQLAQVAKNARLTAELEETLSHLQLAYRQTIEVQEVERRNLAAELHDDILGRLTTMTLTLRNCRKQLSSDPSRVDSWLETLERETHSINRRLREITQGLYPSVLTDLGMVSALRAYIDSLAQQPLPASAPRLITLTVQGFGEARLPNPRLERDLYHITRQALDNAVNHAHAEEVFIHLRWSEAGVSVTVQDTGRGMKDAPEALMGRNSRLGLLSMNERVRAWGGRLSFDTAPGKGTTVYAYLPVEQPSPTPTHLQAFTQHLTRAARD